MLPELLVRRAQFRISDRDQPSEDFGQSDRVGLLVDCADVGAIDAVGCGFDRSLNRSCNTVFDRIHYFDRIDCFN